MNIYLRYINGVVENDKLEKISKELAGHNITLEKMDMSGVPMMSIEELMAPVALILSSEVIQAYVLGLTTNAFYDVIKAAVLSIWHQISGKTYFKVRAKEVKEVEASFDLEVNTPQNVKIKFKLKGDISSELKEKCVDEAFRLINDMALPAIMTGYVCRFNEETESWESYEQVEYIRKFIKNKKA